MVSLCGSDAVVVIHVVIFFRTLTLLFVYSFLGQHRWSFPLLCVAILAVWKFDSDGCSHWNSELTSEDFAGEKVQNLPTSRSSSELSSHQMSIRALSRWLPLVSVPRIMGRAPPQLKGCLLEYIIKFTHCAMGGVAVLILHPQGRWYRSAASARVQPRTPFPTSWSSQWTLQRLVSGSGLLVDSSGR